MTQGRLRATVLEGVDGERRQMVRQALIQFYFQETARQVEEYIRRHAPILGVAPQKVRIANQRSRWGSCSIQGSLRFNWRLSMAPAPVLEYVVVHELCHLKHPNHSERFWAMAQSVLPDFKAHRAWLRNNTFSLNW